MYPHSALASWLYLATALLCRAACPAARCCDDVTKQALEDLFVFGCVFCLPLPVCFVYICRDTPFFSAAPAEKPFTDFVLGMTPVIFQFSPEKVAFRKVLHMLLGDAFYPLNAESVRL